jgi:uncharacterized membrane protein YqjE
MGQLSEQTSRFVRSELQLAKVELTNSAKHAGLGVGLFSVAGVLAWFGLGALIATAIIALDLVLPLWAAALIVTSVLFVAAGIAALVRCLRNSTVVFGYASDDRTGVAGDPDTAGPVAEDGGVHDVAAPQGGPGEGLVVGRPGLGQPGDRSPVRGRPGLGASVAGPLRRKRVPTGSG